MRAQSVLLLNWRDTTNPEGGGSERYVEEVARGLAALGWSVTVLCAAYPGSPREARRHDVRYLYRGTKVTVYLRGLLHTLLHQPDRVVDVQNGLPFFTRLVRRTVVVLVHHVHQEQWQVVYPGWRGRLGWWLESRVAPRLYDDCPYVTVSSASRDELLSLGVQGHRGDPQRHRSGATTPTPAIASTNGRLRRPDRSAQAARARRRRDRGSAQGPSRCATGRCRFRLVGGLAAHVRRRAWSAGRCRVPRPRERGRQARGVRRSLGARTAKPQRGLGPRGR